MPAWIDLIIVLAFIAFSVTAGLIARRKASQNLSQYFLAGKVLRGWQAGTSMAATQFAADTPLLVAGLVATGGLFMLWRLWVYGLAFLLLGFVFAAHWQRARVLTDAELTEIRYSGPGVLFLRIVKALYYGTVMNCVVLAMVLVAAVAIAETFLPWHAWLPTAVYEPIGELVRGLGLDDALVSKAPQYDPALAATNNLISIALIVAFTALYSMTGGLRGVVATDVVQFVLAITGMVLYAIFIVREAGGLGAMTDRLAELYPEQQASRMISFAPLRDALLLPFLMVMALQWVFQRNADGTGYLAQRSMACADERQARLAGVTFAWLQIVLRSIPWVLIAVGLLVVYPFTPAEAEDSAFSAAREVLFVQGVNDLLPYGARGILLTAMLAALASTLDTHMNWGASYWSNDIYQRLICRAWLRREPGGHELVIIARLANLLILAIALVVMANLGSIQQAWHITLLFGAGVGSVLILRWLWERINLWAELAAMGASVILAPLLLAARQRGWYGFESALSAEATGLAIMGGVSTAVVVAVTLLTPRTRPEVLHGFYEQVQPAGWWRSSARATGDDPARPMRELRRELLTTGLTAASLFACLYGAIRLLVPHPERSWWVPAVALVVGVALVPVWWRRANVAREDG